jgi:transporter family protein
MTWLAWALLSAFFAALTALLAKVGVAAIDPNLASAIRTLVIVIFTWIVAFWTRPAAGWHTFSGKAWLFLVLSGLGTGLSWLCYFHALQVGPASRVASVDKLSVVMVILFAAFFLREELSWGKVLGGALILAGGVIIAVE